MTVIVGLVEQDRIIMGADSLASAGYDCGVRRDKKVFKVGDFMIGSCGSPRMKDLLHYKFKPPKQGELQDTRAYMATNFVDAVRDCFKEGGFAKEYYKEEYGGQFMVGYRGRLFVIYGDYQVEESLDSHNSIGCGYPYALGSLHSTEGQDARARVEIALEAAERYSNGCRRPFHILEGS